jgi:hypothetical protein
VIRFVVVSLAYLMWSCAALACDCIGPGVASELGTAAAVFRGKVGRKEEFPRRQRDVRNRYAVHFTVTMRWKGPDAKEIVVYDPAGPTDCDNIDFKEKGEYVVFARQRSIAADDPPDSLMVAMGLSPDFWRDVLAVGSKIFVVRGCTNTTERSWPGFQRTIGELGTGRLVE